MKLEVPTLNAQIVHYTPGRLRIKIPAARHQTAFFAELQQRLLRAEGVLSVTVNPTAASLVIEHDVGIDPIAACRNIPGLAVGSSAAHPLALGVDSGRACDTDVVFLVAKLLPLLFGGHPIAHLAEVLGEPILRAAVDSMMRPRSYPLPAVVHREEEELIAIAA
ncbi:hypothetical protein PYH37_000093 [Sinorhizobium numidicum]|uniref:Uncharacterized protein n=1 Tax=Sinorhizobium numidicum TaxID=680248 RepID=A0ABY8CQ98_9HYPH|nr:hypothetical protein [Sinorhizobium numidicum]WEX74812.1 hypothetical protein PYH37_000093 [Sinorhizobium numidicum]WEX80805.1 hypothetical protein PYH38_000095 [Sinorhizobium numidicum]